MRNTHFHIKYIVYILNNTQIKQHLMSNSAMLGQALLHIQMELLQTFHHLLFLRK